MREAIELHNQLFEELIALQQGGGYSRGRKIQALFKKLKIVREAMHATVVYQTLKNNRHENLSDPQTAA